ncbi:unnamed protein product [Cylindrotheca closterium]|uniref:Uncharacterized protein n=1 Tax=Cylindrotheca closterium TaxID=2856 RepID=A0AAD2CR84_9STRA|nr:unnamed protein product [Cylindrotheca closterium]
MNPTCSIIDCCEPCVDELEAVMNCIAQDALDITQQESNSDCVLTCTATSRRHRRQLEPERKMAGHDGNTANNLFDQMLSPETILAECGLLFETADGLNGLRAGIEELSTRIVEGAFFKCLFESLITLADQGARESSNANAPSPTAAPETAVGSGHFSSPSTLI